MKLYLTVILLTFFVLVCGSDEEHVIKINGPVRQTCAGLRHRGFECVRQVFDDYYVVQKRSHGRYRRDISDTDIDFQYIEELKPLIRDKRTFWDSMADALVPLLDKLLNGGNSVELPKTVAEQQWYIYDTHNLRNASMGIKAAWDRGYFGQNVSVTVVDDGLQRTHDALKENYYAAGSYDLNDEDDDPMPRYNSTFTENRHGTRISGMIGMTQTDTNCGKGIAFKSKLGGIRLLDGMVTDELEAKSFIKRMDTVDIKSFSWGPPDDAEAWDGPGHMGRDAMEKSIRQGRNGLGTIFVWAVGNGGFKGDNCGADGYSGAVETITISSVLSNGEVPGFVEQCSATFATTFSTGRPGNGGTLITTDLNNECTNDLTATSASAGIASAIYALLLSSRSDLGWRDVQHLTVRNSKLQGLDIVGRINGAGYPFHSHIGFGLLNANDMITMAEKWEKVPEKHICQIPFPTTSGAGGHHATRNRLALPVTADGCRNDDDAVIQLEHVQLEMTLLFDDKVLSKRGRLQILLKSPSGTESSLLETRGFDSDSKGFQAWNFTSVHFWGERPIGDWKLTIYNHEYSNKGFKLFNVRLYLHGTPATLREPSTPTEDIICKIGEVSHEQTCMYNCPDNLVPTSLEAKTICEAENVTVKLGKNKLFNFT